MGCHTLAESGERDPIMCRIVSATNAEFIWEINACLCRHKYSRVSVPRPDVSPPVAYFVPCAAPAVSLCRNRVGETPVIPDDVNRHATTLLLLLLCFD